MPVKKEPDTGGVTKDIIVLPEQWNSGGISVKEALLEKRPVRNYKDEVLMLTEVSQLLWAAQGITNPGGYRTAPLAGALYPRQCWCSRKYGEWCGMWTDERAYGMCIWRWDMRLGMFICRRSRRVCGLWLWGKTRVGMGEFGQNSVSHTFMK